jgi:hypothetical protein
MRSITKFLLALNGVSLLFIVLWLLVGGGQRGYFGGGGASEVDGVLLLFLGLFNISFLAAVLFVLPAPSSTEPAPVQAAVGHGPGQPAFQDAVVGEMLNQQVASHMSSARSLLRKWSQWALCVNGVLILFVGLWLLVSSGRWGYFQANATEVDMVLLLFLSILNIAYMGLIYLLFSRPQRA